MVKRFLPNFKTGLACVIIAVGFILPVNAAELGNYSVANLLKTCEEGDNDARWSAQLELTCEQFIDGFTGAYLLLTDGGKSQAVCLPPPENRSDVMRWAFMKWAYANFDRRHIPAAEGLMDMAKDSFPCG